MITPVWIIGFTGHRPNQNPGRTHEALASVEPAIKQVLSDLQKRAAGLGGRADLLCSLAAGADLIAAQAAESIGMIVHIILPLPQAEFEKDFASSRDEWAEALRFIEAAQEGKNGATFRVAEGPQTREHCFYNAGMKMVEASDAVLAVWDGAETALLRPNAGASAGRGGTADIVALAEADMMPFLRGMAPQDGYVWRPTPCVIIDPVTGSVRGSAEDFATPSDAGFSEIKAVRHAAFMNAEPPASQAAGTEFFAVTRTTAIDWAKRFRRVLIAGVVMHGVASLVAAAAASAEESLSSPSLAVLAAVELVLVALAFGGMLWAHRKHAQACWLELRLATEITRSLRAAGRILDPLFPLITRHLPGWRRFSISVHLKICQSLPSSWNLTDEVARYLGDRLEHQLAWFRTRNPMEKLGHRIAACIGSATAALAVIVVLFALIHKIIVALDQEPAGAHADSLWETAIYQFLPIALPLIAGAASALQTATDSKRRSHVHPEIIERLQSSTNYITAIRTAPALQQFVARTEEVLIDELIGWYAAAKGISH